MAVCTGLIVANLYYCQPLVVLVARDLHISNSVAGQLNYITQAGYAAGLLFLVPLGDLIERKRQILVVNCICVIALICAAVSPSFLMLEIASFAIGFTTIVPQLILPLAAQLADPEKRGKTIGTVMSGLVLGILLSRTVSGLIGAAYGWRTVYWIAAVVCSLLLFIMAIRFPKSKPSFKGTYGELMRSLLTLLPEPVLQEACMINALTFGTFGAFWTTMVLYLSGAPFYYNSGQIGLFGLAGVAGALAAPIAGKLGDKGNPRNVILLGVLMILISFIAFYFLRTSFIGFIAAIIFLDFGLQAVHISNQTRVYSLIPAARNRLNTIYMTITFTGTAVGSALGLYFWHVGGWGAFCIGCGNFMIIALVIYAFYNKRLTTLHKAKSIA